ncbi:MAG: hypothetical protein CMJ31_06780 [Phycisphaerae bacterium]|nr:hypothetical protein [Phycisphaerae bacterium]
MRERAESADRAETNGSGNAHDTGRASAPRRSAANRFGVDYRAEARTFAAPPRPIIDGHCHINGERASVIFRDVMDAYGVERVYSQTQLADAEAVRANLGDRVRFVAIPEYSAGSRHAFTDGFLANLDVWHAEYGARMVKLWHAPRWRDFARAMGGDPTELLELDGAWKRRIADRAVELGMVLMTHTGDPDTWFATKYKDASVYGTKAYQYEALERMMELYPVPWLLAHMGGWPEDLDFLAGLLERHPKAVVDTSATKWMVRELSKHDRAKLVGFLERFEGRVVFGSDIVTHDEHLSVSDSARFAADLASNEDEAFDLYASRYWALRTMWESDYEGESNIADPDLAMVEPDRYDAMSAPALVGRGLPREMLDVLYRGACEGTLDRWYQSR